MRLLSIGEVLWDLFEDEERLGGAPLNVAVNAARLGHSSAILTAVGDDERGRAAVQAIQSMGVSAEFIATTDRASTGTASVQLDSAGTPMFTIARPAAYDFPPGGAVVASIAAWDPDWIVFGSLAQLAPPTRDLTETVFAACPRSERLFDMNLRAGHSPAPILPFLLGSATIVKANLEEAAWLAEATEVAVQGVERDPEPLLRALVTRFAWRGMSVTQGAQGASLLLDGEYVAVAAPDVPVVDTVGAGDAFAAALLHGIDAGWPARRAATFSTSVGALVASRRGATPEWTLADLAVAG